MAREKRSAPSSQEEPFPDFPPPGTIDDVVAALDRIITWSLATESRLGYFAALYRKVTLKVKEGIEDGFFEDGPRMERLDVVFATRYLEALRSFETGEKPTDSWQVAFDASGRWRYLILQQLLVGINAHINLDLGIAAATIAPGDRLPALRTDFDRINEILFSLVKEVEEEIGEVSPWLGWLARFGGKLGDELIRFSLEVARSGAWRLARRLAPRPEDEWGPAITHRDEGTARLGREILSPGPFLRWGVALIRLRESNDVRRNIQVLAGTSELRLEAIEASRRARSPLP